MPTSSGECGLRVPDRADGREYDERRKVVLGVRWEEDV